MVNITGNDKFFLINILDIPRILWIKFSYNLTKRKTMMKIINFFP